MSTIQVNLMADSQGGSVAPISSVMRNRIQNGAMVIDQRNAGASVTSTGADYCLDRWQMLASVTSKFSVQQNAGSITPPAGFKNYLGVTSLAATSLGATDYYLITQKIEGFNIADLNWGTANASSVTVSFFVRSSLTGTFGFVLRNSAGNRLYPESYTISTANTWEQKSVTIAGDTTGTWLTDSSIGVEIDFGLGVGSTFSNTAGAWTTGGLGVTGATSVVGTNGATWQVTGVQLEKGTQATGFEYRQYGQELALCQRYFEKSYNIETVPGTATFIGSITNFTAAFAVYFPIAFKVQKRATPTVVGYSPFDGSTGNFSINNTSTALTGIISTGQWGTTPYYGESPGNSSNYLHFAASAEL